MPAREKTRRAPANTEPPSKNALPDAKAKLDERAAAPAETRSR